MKIYLVGGAVRDSLLEKQCNDKDYVVVGSTIEEMESLGFKQVGKEFPVFLHPQTNEEYALARTERKIGDKHTDFTFEFNPDITLEEDLVRRDFTVNAMALDAENNVIDYFGGMFDLENKVLRAVRPETFIEDPLRVLRGCRFAAQLDFDIEPSTMELFTKMVNDGMLNHLTSERVWKETEKALQPNFKSHRYFELLLECGALKVLFPELYDVSLAPEQIKYHPSGNSFKHTMIALQRVEDKSSLIKFATLVHDLGKGNTPKEILPKHNDHDIRGLDLIESMCERIKIPNKYKDFAKLFCKNHMRIAKFNDMNLNKKYDLISEISNGFKDEDKLEDFMYCFYSDYFGEETLTEYNSIEQYDSIFYNAFKVFDIMCGVTLKTLDETTQNNLSRHKGEKFGKLYRDAKIDYLRQRFNS